MSTFDPGMSVFKTCIRILRVLALSINLYTCMHLKMVSDIWRPYFIRIDNPAKLHAHAYANNIMKCVNPEHVHNTSTMQFQA